MAVQYTLQPVLPIPNTRTSDPPRPFTSVNLCLRPPSSEPQPPIEIQSGQSITYSTTSFDPNKGFQSQLQIRIGPGKYAFPFPKKNIQMGEGAFARLLPAF